jgi:hypothetical protein
VDGWEEVEAQTYSCNSNDHRGVFEIGINKGEGGFCDEAVVDVVELYHEGIAVQHAVPQPATKFIGDPNDSCAGGNTFVLVTNTFTGPDDHLYCTDTTGISWDGIAQNNITNNYENAPCSDYIGSYPTL